MSHNQGSPPFIPFSRPSIGPEEEAAVISVLRSGWLTTAGVTARFEKEFALYVGARHALALSSATAGLHLSLEALRVGEGGYVITTPYTFTATAEVARYLGAEVAFVDIDEGTNNIDPARLEEKLETLAREGKAAAAVIPVHVAGLPCDMTSICGLASRFGVPVVEDAAHAFPVKSRGRMVGTIGEIGVYSFYPTKSITTGEGGMVVTDDDGVAERIRIMRLHGIDRDIWDRYTSVGASWRYDVVAPGYKYNLSDIASAIGLCQLSKVQAFLQRRRTIARRYCEGLSACGFLTLPPDVEEHGWHLFMIRIKPDKLLIGRDRFMEELQARGIGISVHFIPLHIMSYYRDRYGLRPEDFPVALGNFLTSISLPLYPSLTDDEVERVIAAVLEIGRRHAKP